MRRSVRPSRLGLAVLTGSNRGRRRAWRVIHSGAGANRRGARDQHSDHVQQSARGFALSRRCNLRVGRRREDRDRHLAEWSSGRCENPKHHPAQQRSSGGKPEDQVCLTGSCPSPGGRKRSAQLPRGLCSRSVIRLRWARFISRVNCNSPAAGHRDGSFIRMKRIYRITRIFLLLFLSTAPIGD